MSDQPPRVVLESSQGECAVARVRWDGESHTLAMSILYPDKGERRDALLLSQQLDLARGIELEERRLMLGDLEITFGAQERMHLLEIRTNPLDWVQGPLTSLPSDREPVTVHFLADFDAHGIATLRVPVRICRDLAQRTLSFQFGSYLSARWADVAVGLAIGVTQDSYLSEFRMMNVDLPI